MILQRRLQKSRGRIAPIAARFFVPTPATSADRVTAWQEALL
jgi:hypothetical protein